MLLYVLLHNIWTNVAISFYLKIKQTAELQGIVRSRSQCVVGGILCVQSVSDYMITVANRGNSVISLWL